MEEFQWAHISDLFMSTKITLHVVYKRIDDHTIIYHISWFSTSAAIVFHGWVKSHSIFFTYFDPKYTLFRSPILMQGWVRFLTSTINSVKTLLFVRRTTSRLDPPIPFIICWSTAGNHEMSLVLSWIHVSRFPPLPAMLVSRVCLGTNVSTLKRKERKFRKRFNNYDREYRCPAA